MEMSSIKEKLNIARLNIAKKMLIIKKKKKTKLDSCTLTIIENSRVKVVFDFNKPLWNARFISNHNIVGLHTLINE